MKSSLRPASDPSIQAAPSVWKPLDLTPPRQDHPTAQAQEILSVLSPGLKTGNPVNSAAIPHAPAWVPDELNNPRSLTKPVWKTIDPPTSTSTIARVDLRPEAENAALQILKMAHDEAAQIVQKAEEQAAEVRRQAQEEADELALRAHQQGWAAAEAEAGEIIQTFQKIVHQVEAWHEELMAQSESAVLDMVREMATVMFGDGFVMDGQALQMNFNRILADSRSLGDLRIYVNPEDAANLDPYWREFQVSISGHQVQIIPSENIHRGGCFIDGQWGSIDARIETQLKTILNTLSESGPAENGAPESSAD